MPATLAIESNEARSQRLRDYAFPPCIIIEKGQSLNEWAHANRCDFVTIFQVRPPRLQPYPAPCTTSENAFRRHAMPTRSAPKMRSAARPEHRGFQTLPPNRARPGYAGVRRPSHRQHPECQYTSDRAAPPIMHACVPCRR